ncbi:hypothetical protein OPV43_183 [Saccharomyces cerevisiae synthetic construct]|uniref:Putative uncharacterized protein YAL045C n=1 Tax=Saccharomyces cerevisiae (strain ATCC 204508 / S288c) TaxID=559292 RepID=YAE5_YEAST|nr:RecName: Full=Putative uncharacterized protein YAL045C [Saccharomyces cerevisiae S288C]AAC04986.1 Yal045cp [Saccharomyces cerevisiae]KZV13417.1 hypothetical protein WN66_00027 [Saccharomyces cerevisiae]UZT75931.1 hypothetical protein OPV43_183 [Saccharomyces cerevisiae synthetic construct]
MDTVRLSHLVLQEGINHTMALWKFQAFELFTDHLNPEMCLSRDISLYTSMALMLVRIVVEAKRKVLVIWKAAFQSLQDGTCHGTICAHCSLEHYSLSTFVCC